MKLWTELNWIFDDHGWRFIASGILPSWREFAYDQGDSRYQREYVEFRLAREDTDADQDLVLDIPLGSQNAYEWLRAHEAATHAAILAELRAHLPSLIAQWQEFSDPELNDIQSIDDLKDKFNLAYVTLFPHSQYGMPYFGFDFDCAWDSEGFRILMNGTRVAVMQADELSVQSVLEDGGIELQSD